MSHRSLEGKLAIVTGASRGIGVGICKNLAAKGANLIMVYTSASSQKPAEDLAAQLQDSHKITTLIVRCDMGDESAPGKMVSHAAQHFGQGFQIDIIVNNAGIAGNQALADVQASEFHRQYATNVLGPLMLMQAALPYLPNDRSGRIVNVSSISTSLGNATQSVYAGTKGALESMTRVWARELANQATVNAINPGPVDTEMYRSNGPEFYRAMKPLNQLAPRAHPGVPEQELEETGGRAATVDEIAGVIGMLVSAESSWCTGSVICANGGMRMSP